MTSIYTDDEIVLMVERRPSRALPQAETCHMRR